MTPDDRKRLRELLTEAASTTDEPGKWIPREPVTPQRRLLCAAVNALPSLLDQLEAVERDLAKEREFATQLVRVVEAAVTWKQVADDPGAAVWPFTEKLDAAIDAYVEWHKAQFVKERS